MVLVIDFNLNKNQFLYIRKFIQIYLFMKNYPNLQEFVLLLPE